MPNEKTAIAFAALRHCLGLPNLTLRNAVTEAMLQKNREELFAATGAKIVLKKHETNLAQKAVDTIVQFGKMERMREWHRSHRS